MRWAAWGGVGRESKVVFGGTAVAELRPSVAQLVERLTVVFYTVSQYTRKSIGRWFDSGHSDLYSSFGLYAEALLSCIGTVCYRTATTSMRAVAHSDGQTLAWTLIQPGFICIIV